MVRNFLFSVFVLNLMNISFPTDVHAKAHCWCKIATGQPTPTATVSGVVKDLSPVASYPTQYNHDSDCNSACGQAASSHFSGLTSAVQNSYCSAGNIFSYYAVGTRDYRGGQQISCPISGGGGGGNPTLFEVSQVPNLPGLTSNLTIGIDNASLNPTRNYVLHVAELAPLVYNGFSYAIPKLSLSTPVVKMNFPTTSKGQYRFTLKRKNKHVGFTNVTHINIIVN